MHPRTPRTVLLAIGLLAGACGSTTDTTATETTATETATESAGTGTDTESTGSDDAPSDDIESDDTTTADGVDAAEREAVLMAAAWGDDVTITVDGDTVRFSSNGVPDHEVLDAYVADGRDGKYIAGGVSAYDATFSFPLEPTLNDTPTGTPFGAIGVAVSGAVFFDPFEGDGSGIVANDDQTEIDGVPFIDACGGHPLPNEISYHYHGIPFCITDALDTPGEHSALIGYLFDGVPIYGPQDVGGDAPTDLDECLGHVGPTPEFSADVYHYHVSAEANYISECFRGVATTNR